MSGVAKKTVQIFYDVVSPYSWIGFETLCRHQYVWNIEVKLRPVFLGAIMQSTDNQPPMMVPARGAYMKKDLHRNAEYYQIPLSEPKDVVDVMIVKGTMSSMRFLTATSLTCPEKVEDLSRALWNRIWSKDLDITEPSSLLEAAKAAGIKEAQAETILGKLKSQETKDTLKATTQEALDHGAFGAPVFVLDDKNNKSHMLFGSDRFHLMAHLLGEEFQGPLLEHSKTKNL